MGLPLYLARTPWEIPEDDALHTAYMACHFSPYGAGLETYGEIPRCGMVICNDRVPLLGHDPRLIYHQLGLILEQTGADSLLLDFQRRDPADADLVKTLQALPCPVAVTELYADCCSGPVFAEVPMHRPLCDATARWQDRLLWLDVAGNAQRFTVTADGSRSSCLPPFVPDGICHREESLHCSYHIQVFPDRAEFTLFRTKEDLCDLLQEAGQLGFAKAVGLHQELHSLV